ncbi:MAG: sigma-70 family RNA polymerase sigma factor [Planctomycetota bacterium]|jgi:RNA polymerase sigma factor (TIGR02999 family)
MSEPAESATRLIQRASAGDRAAADELMTRLYDELRALAVAAMGSERTDHTLQPTALVHEAYLRLAEIDRMTWKDGVHFRAVAARMMRRVLIDHARSRGTAKRGGDRLKVTLNELPGPSSDGVTDMLDLDDALRRLKEHKERHAAVVELRFFGGLTHEETAEVLGVSSHTVRLDWSMARAWLHQQLDAGPPTGSPSGAPPTGAPTAVDRPGEPPEAPSATEQTC